MASSILGRKVFPAAAAALTANVASSNGISSLLDGKFDGGWINSSRSSSLCEVMKSNASGKSNKTNENMFLLRESGISEKVLRKRVSAMFNLCSQLRGLIAPHRILDDINWKIQYEIRIRG